MDCVSDRAPLVEVFGSIQGEARFAGVPMAFVRVARCPIRCLYCDTPYSYEPTATCAVRGPRGHSRELNPVSGARAAALAAEVGPGLRRLSVTGGEPLLYPGFVRALGEAYAGQLHLETAALHPAALRECLPAVAHLSADYKLPGTLERGDYRAQHLDCERLGVEAGISVDVKLVLTNAVADADVARALAELAPLRQGVLLVLQPVTPFGRVREGVAMDRVRDWAAAAGEAGFELRVLPQVHALLGCE